MNFNFTMFLSDMCTNENIPCLCVQGPHIFHGELEGGG